MGTWLDTQPATIIRSALGTDTTSADDGSERYGLWLQLVDLHLDQLHVERHRLEWDWQAGYDQGWSPRTAAFAAWAKHLRPVPTAGQKA